MHSLWASMRCPQCSSPFSMMHASRAFLVSGQAQQGFSGFFSWASGGAGLAAASPGIFPGESNYERTRAKLPNSEKTFPPVPIQEDLRFEDGSSFYPTRSLSLLVENSSQNRSLGTFANWLVMSVYLQRKWPAAYTKMSSYLSCVISTPSWDERPGCWRKTWLAAFAWFSAPTNGVWKLTHVATAFERWRWDCCVWSWRPSWATQLQASRQARLYTHTHTLYS